jgi:hypothetical protein
VVAADPGTLPSYAILIDGTPRVQDVGTLNSVTAWTRAVGFAMQTLAVSVARSPQEQWTLDPVADYSRLEALRCACNWVVRGPGEGCDHCQSLLADPEKDLSPGSHFGVLARLERLPKGWLHVGRLDEVPLSACYKAHCGTTWVWVTPDGMEGLNDFILVFHDIATIDIDSGATVTPPVLVTLTVIQPFPPTRFKLNDKLTEWLRDTAKVPGDLLKILPALKKPFRSADEFVQELLTRDLKAFLKGDNLKYFTEHAREGVQPVDPPYNKQLQFAELRSIRPEYLGLIRQRMREATAAGNLAAISWQDWMTYSVPFHGTRSNVKADGSIGQVPPPSAALRGPLLGPLPPSPPGFQLRVQSLGEIPDTETTPRP